MKIEVKNLSFAYDERKVLDNVSLCAEGGEFVSILGSNGVGKSTLFRCMLGLLSGYSGEVLLDGTEIRKLTVREISEKVAYIPQHSNPAFNYSVEQIILMGTTAGTRAFERPKEAERLRVRDAMKKMGIEHLSQRCFHRLSGGERQLVIIARALAQNAGILMLDEPTSALDFGNQLLVMTRARQLADEGYTVIQTTHNPDQAYLFSDRIVAIKNGAVVKDGTPDEVINDNTISELYNAQAKVVSIENGRYKVCLPLA